MIIKEHGIKDLIKGEVKNKSKKGLDSS